MRKARFVGVQLSVPNDAESSSRVVEAMMREIMKWTVKGRGL